MIYNMDYIKSVCANILMYAFIMYREESLLTNTFVINRRRAAMVRQKHQNQICFDFSLDSFFIFNFNELLEVQIGVHSEIFLEKIESTCKRLHVLKLHTHFF